MHNCLYKKNVLLSEHFETIIYKDYTVSLMRFNENIADTYSKLSYKTGGDLWEIYIFIMIWVFHK